MPVPWTQPASAQLTEMHRYIADSRRDAADRQVAILVHSVDGLRDFPERGRPGRRRGTRELVVVPGTSYVVAYRIRGTKIEVLAILHGARRWPRNFAE